MADVVDSKSTVRKGVRVRIPPRARTLHPIFGSGLTSHEGNSCRVGGRQWPFTDGLAVNPRGAEVAASVVPAEEYELVRGRIRGG